MIELELYKNNLIQVKTGDAGFLVDLKKFFTEHVEGYLFMPKYKSGQWDGTISLFDINKHTFPYGLIFDFVKFYKKSYSDIPIKMSPDIKKMFIGYNNLKQDFNLKFKPRSYQLECINESLKAKNSIFVCGTSGGKSLILTYIWKILNDNDIISNIILVVPTINLVTQFKNDMIDYGIIESDIGEVYGDIKEWNKKIVISTWQTLINNIDKLELYDAIMIDETHQAKATSLITILQNCNHMLFKVGCTGTLPDNRLDTLNIKSYLGPITKSFPVSYLIKKGYISECKINIYNIKYKKPFEGNFNQIKDQVFMNDFRLSFISNIIKSVKNDNILLLVGKIEKEGKIIESYLKNIEEFKNKQIKFIYGKTKPKERELWRKKCINENGIILIAVYPLFQLGINIPNLNHIILASSNKAKIRTLQSIGRSLRKNGSDEAIIYDIVDYSNKFLPKHGKERQKFYKTEKFITKIIDVKES